MDIISSIKKGVKAIYDDIKTPDSFKIGEAFERYCRNVIFPKGFFELIHQARSYSENKNDYSKDSLAPDFEFKDLKTKKIFHIECKYRSKKEEDDNALLEICKDYQLKRYQDLNKKNPVFILLGLDFKNNNENLSLKDLREIYGSLENAFIDIPILLIPVTVLNSNQFDLNNMVDYTISNVTPFSSKILWNYFADSKNFFGYCIRCQISIPEFIGKPLCENCFKEWNKFKNKDYKEKFCHSCGQENKTTISRPYCKSCYFGK